MKLLAVEVPGAPHLAATANMRNHVHHPAVQNRQCGDREHGVHRNFVGSVSVLKHRMRLRQVKIGTVNHRNGDEGSIGGGCPVTVGTIILTLVTPKHRGLTAQKQGLRHGEVIVYAARS